ncbi:MAG: L-rhamnose mutarotase [Chloroflexi bacterium]|nr:L-rhamnose mutarotase [Chloroflexota bacterium]
MPTQRFGQVVRLKPDAFDEYKRLHDSIWPELVDAMRAANLHNSTIFHHANMLFMYYEYWGEDLEADLARVSESPQSREWAQLTNALQMSLDGRTTDDPDDDLWTPLAEIFHID